MENTFAKLIFIPTPGHGHIMSTVQIAKLLVNRDQRLSITVLVIKPLSFGSHTATNTYIESLAKYTTSRISFIELPQDIPPPFGDSKPSFSFFNDFIESHCKYVRNIVADIVTQPGSDRLAGFVIDMFCTCMIEIANEFNVPSYVFYTSNASLLGFKFYIQLLDQSQDVVKLSKSDTEVSVPSYAKPVPTRVFWDIVQTRAGMDYILTIIRKIREVKGIMVNTFSDLEAHAIMSLSDDISIPPVYPVGPILNLESVAGQQSDDVDIIRWLDSQPPSSVVFLCFGSMGSFDEIQVKEIARALEQSGHRFLWSLRQSPLDQIPRIPSDYEDFGAVLPEGFLDRTHGIGKVIGWAPQVAVLAHDAVGGFVSHCGWNSLLESLWFGVPTAAWPMYAEQQMNAFKMVVEMGLAVEIKLDYRKDMFNVNANIVTVTAEEIESGMRRVMEDNEVRTKVKEMSDKCKGAMAEGGSSYASVGCFIQDVIQNIS
uniref:anthocyanidin 3-O-glucosyltransferase 2-like n=1 Tax=Erigeron canadensis TaxID=72917 RepID=UPI001CB9A69C|nr:anthocyanidin 3-O-glucosyltransferase 2-like [Erigeron canadensis]